MDPATMYDRAATKAAMLARQVTPEQRGLPTPCTEWDVAALLDHMALGPAHLLFAAGVEADGPSWPDPRSIERCVEALRSPGALERRCAAPTGLQLSLAEVASGTTMDQLIHTWDLAVGTGGDRRAGWRGRRGDRGDVLAAVARTEPTSRIGRSGGLGRKRRLCPRSASGCDGTEL